jgi:hypothetical protein
MAAGDFSSSELVEIKLKAEQIYKGETAESAHYSAEVEGIKALLANQTAKVAPLQGYQTKDNVMGINWLDATTVADAADADSCTITEAEIETKAQPVELTLTRKAGFSVSDVKLRNSIFSREEVVAKAMLAAMKELDEYWAAQFITFLNANAGTPVTGSEADLGTWTVGTKTVDVPTASYNSAMIPGIQKMAILNKIRDSFLLDNGALYISFMNARYNAGNAEGKGDQARFGALPIYFDMFNFSAAAVTPDDTYLIGKNAVAHATRTRYQGAPVDFPDEQKRYSVASYNLPGVNYEAIYQLSCSGDELVHSWRFRTKGGFYINPTAVATNNGIIGMAKV